MPKMSVSDCANLKARIDRLRESYEALLEGRKARVLVDQNGERIEYNAGNPGKLLTYITMLESDYNSGCGLRPVAASKPVRFFF